MTVEELITILNHHSINKKSIVEVRTKTDAENCTKVTSFYDKTIICGENE